MEADIDDSMESKSTFAPHLKVIKIDDDEPGDKLVQAFTGQDSVVSVSPGRPYTLQMQMIDAAVRAGVKPFIPTEYGNNTCAAASELSPLVYHLNKKRAIVYDLGNQPWSTTKIGTAALAIVKVLQKQTETVNRSVFVASFTVSQNQVLKALEDDSGNKRKTNHMTRAKALCKAKELADKDHSPGLKVIILMLLYAEDADRGGDFGKDGLLDNKLLSLPEESMEESI
ncbi:hypothetical protein HJFPF1_08451 [Paramyrothecium foliicola]|nr:hypothetical protein HJFPF1_08451 [Paramyrothecium foliicola]